MDQPIQLRDCDEGEKLIARAMEEIGPTHRCLLARARLRKDDVESQIADASEAIHLSPAYAEAHLFLARALLGREEADKALGHLKLALKELPLLAKEVLKVALDIANGAMRSKRTASRPAE